MKNILIYHIGGIGDSLVALPSFQAIRKHYPESRLHLLNYAVIPSKQHLTLYGDLFESMVWLDPHLGKIRLYTAFLKAVLSRKYDLAFAFSPDFPKVLSLFLKLIRRIPLHFCSAYPPSGRVADFYLDTLKTKYGIPSDKNCFEFISEQEEYELAEQVRKNLPQNLAAIGIGGNQPVCRWGLDRWRELLKNLIAEYHFFPVFIGGDHDRKDAAELIDFLETGIFLPDTACKSLRDTIAFLRHCRFYLGHDTGSLHMAAAAGIPCAAIFSAHDIPAERWHPAGEKNLVLRKEFHCQGCGLRECPVSTPPQCIRAISVCEAQEAIHVWLEKISENGGGLCSRKAENPA